MRKWNIALGFYQNFSTAEKVLKKLRRRGYQRVAYFHHDIDGNLVVKRSYPFFHLIGTFLALFLVISSLILFKYHSLLSLNWASLAGIITTAIIGTFLVWRYTSKIEPPLINRCKKLIGIDEILVVVQSNRDDVIDVLSTLRQVTTGHPVSFLLRADVFEGEDYVELSKEPLTNEQLRQHASTLAASLTETTLLPGQPLLNCLKRGKKILQFLRHDVAEAEYIEQTLTLSAEWLLDNMYVIEGSIEEVQRNLPKKYYSVLPKIAKGPQAGLPRIYALAIEIVNSCAGRLSRQSIIDFLNSYQTVDPLTIGELWALPLMLRLRLIEVVQSLAIEVDRRMREGELASFWGNRLLYAARREPKRLSAFLAELAQAQPSPSPHFAEELLEHLFDEEAVLPMVRKWLEGLFATPIADVILQEQAHETADQVAFSSSIISLITLSQLTWPDIFEAVSSVDAILKEDPVNVYSRMDFKTRNRYRESIETIARRSHISELNIAKQALQLASSASSEVERHIGYYLIDSGRPSLEQLTHYKPSFFRCLRRFIKSHPILVYLGGIGAITLILEACLFYYSLNSHESVLLGTIIAILSLLPLSELSIQVVNLILTRILRPSALPKMLYEEGIPEEDKTLVVVPMMLLTSEAIKEELHKLEIRYLANSDPSLRFGLFSDFSDAPEQHMKDDVSLLDVAIKGIETLAAKYGPGRFFLFHRQRVWSVSENVWIGWERKRGKLEYLNRFLMGEQLPENILYVGQPENMKGIRYVITLDADTQLPKNKARELIEVLSHPLNRPYLRPDGKGLARGYTIIQPRVCTDFSHTRASWFSRIFSDPSIIDPYTQAISNIYQDLTGEGAYHGKGIYDLQAFHQILSGRYPEEHLLSHDLLEGAYVRVGFASDICLFDLFPEDYLSWSYRQHRWMRGDFQIADWLLPHVRSGNSHREVNPLSPINRWKIFDNLRRALLPVSIILLLVLAWMLSPVAGVLTGIVTLVLFTPSISLFISQLVTFSFPGTKWSLSELFLAFLRDIISASLLPYEAYLTLDAMCRVAYRKLISHRKLLQWITPEYGNRCHRRKHQRFLLRLLWISVFALLTFLSVTFFHPIAQFIALPFCFLWLLAPVIASVIDKPLDLRKGQDLLDVDKDLLRQIARKTWRYFDDFVGPQSHWLPPDNYQTALKIEVAQRTSPTNIGLWLMGVLSAYDFKYITCDLVVDKVLNTIQCLKKLERHEGHILNWYDIQSLAPLYPRYISTVDSGNLLACLWTLEQGMYEMMSVPILPTTALTGVKDTLDVLIQESVNNKNLEKALFAFHPTIFELLRTPVNDIDTLITTTRHAQQITRELIAEGYTDDAESLYWLKQIEKQLTDWDTLIGRYFSWFDLLKSLTKEQLALVDNQAATWRDEALALNPSMHTLASGEFSTALGKMIASSQKAEQSADIKAWGKKLEEALASAQWFAGEQVGRIKELIADLKQLSEEMKLRFLFNSDRKLFSIGYNVDEKKLDNSYYDLLASEARIASLVAIAKEDFPLEHWWSLGRPYTTVEGRRVLLSWGGTMFEYLMPLLFNKYFYDSLLGEACQSVVECQIKYGKKRGIPWGISEAAFSAIDEHKTYQYRSFGIPGVGLKRSLEEDLVVSPYSSALALAINAPEAVKNLKLLAKRKHASLLGPYGYYESIDYMRQHSPKGERGVIVYAYMAHHQGMILSAINNVLNNDIMPNRFHADPRISGVESLLYERIPSNPAIKVSGIRKDSLMTRLQPFSIRPIMGVVDTPQSVIPKVNLLSNGNYSIMVTNAGGGYSRWRDIDITRWRADTTQDSFGNFYYVKDVDSNEFWSLTYQPTQKVGPEYSVSFKTDKSEFRRKDHQIESFTDVFVSPEDDAEIWLITLVNHSAQTRHLELTSYIELALASHATDRSHPCFNKMFIETEALTELSGLLAFRRLRSPNDPPLFAAHIVSTDQLAEGPVQYETDRSRFIGRGNSLQHPAALDENLSNTTGTVLDPIFSLRKRVVIEPGHRVQLSFVTAFADNRDKAISLVEKYRDFAAIHRASELAWTHGQLELRHLRIHEDEVQLFQKLAGRVIYPHSQLRSSEESLRSNLLGQSGLWGQGISGDLPIVVATVGDIYDIELVKQVLIAHAFWNLRGLKTDLVILNEEVTGYEHPLLEQLQRIINAYAYRGQVNTPGGVFLRNSDQMPSEELTLILSVARAVLVAARGTLRQQLVSPMPARTYPQRLTLNRNVKDTPSRPLPFLELPYFNSLGGFSADGREYTIYLGASKHTPAPWINVIANPQFGTLVSEAGMGCTWYGNSQTNRITPWSNDPLVNPIADAIYIRDEELGTVWTPTPAPIRELDAYRVHHGQGYSRFEHNSHGIEQDLLTFVPVDDAGGLPLRIQRLRLSNHSNRRRHLTVTAYSELVLGIDHEQSQMSVITDWDPESQGLFAYNRYNPDFSGHLAFSSSIPSATSFTADRAEFLGRNHTTSNPAALKRKGLSGNTGAALDPCSALQVSVELEAGAQTEVIFILGYAPNAIDARKLILQCRGAGMVDKLFAETQAWWDKMLGTIQVDVPDLSTTFSLNRWLLYQNLSCRFWGRTAFYQSSGAFGFRDQLQDAMSLVYSVPELARKHILTAAARQFVEGDVQHWWQPQSGAGVRTRITDDLLWLPYATAQYVRVTGDVSILDEQIPFLQAPELTEDQHEVYTVPTVTQETDTLLEHCRRAIYKGMKTGDHGLPLMGGGDWNDGMNRVGIKGKGESVWLAWFLIHVMHDFADLLSSRGQQDSGEGFRTQAKRLAEAAENTAWDGRWYRRAYFDDGSPLGSKDTPEASIDSLAQSWAVICGMANPERSTTALKAAEEYLVRAKENIVLLLTPPFDKSSVDPGYIKGYPPGVRENGGQYTHGSLWLAMAFARKGDGDKAVDLLHMMHPLAHSQNEEALKLYKVEPYVLAADIYDLQGQVGRGGWTWYSGSAGWMYRIWIEEILGFKLRNNILKIDCCIPSQWDGFKLHYRYHDTSYEIIVKNPNHISKGKTTVKLDGQNLPTEEISLNNDKLKHTIEVTIEK